MKKLNWFDAVCMILVIVGAINWGLVGLFGFNLVHAIFGTVISRIIFVIVGLAGLYEIYFASKLCKCCRKNGDSVNKSPADDTH